MWRGSAGSVYQYILYQRALQSGLLGTSGLTGSTGQGLGTSLGGSTMTALAVRKA